MAIRLLVLAVLMTFATVLSLAIVILDDPPAIVGFIFGTFNGSGWIGIIVLCLRRYEHG